VRGFHEPGEFGRRNQGDIARPSSSNDYSVLLIYHLIKHSCQVLPEAAIRCFTRHGNPRLHCTGFLYVRGFHKIAHLDASESCVRSGSRSYADLSGVMREVLILRTIRLVKSSPTCALPIEAEE